MKSNQFHTSFKLNEVSFSSVDELLHFSKSINNSVFKFLSDWFNNDDFVIVKTSGSTGKPKLIQLKKNFMVNSAQSTGSFFNLQENTFALLCLSTDYIAGKMMLVRALTLGWSLDIIKPTNNPLKNIEKKYHFSAMVPLQLQNSLSYIYKVEMLIVGGGVVSQKLQEKLQNISTKVFATYGMTETITHIAIKKLNKFKIADIDKVEKSFYQTLKNVSIFIDERSCLVVEAPKVSDELIITNDVVQLISENKFEWLGRFDNVINSGGIKLYPEKIEEKLTPIIKQRFFVAGIIDSILGEKLILIIEGNRNDVTATLADKSLEFEIKTLKSLTKYEVPKEIYFLDKFIETKTNKIQRDKTLKKVLF